METVNKIPSAKMPTRLVTASALNARATEIEKKMPDINTTL